MDFHSPDPAHKRCAKCLTVMAAPDWVVNKEMAYCAECAALLHLGESKESRMFSDMRELEAGGPVPADIALIPTEEPEAVPPD
jgi:hypothetical protein